MSEGLLKLENLCVTHTPQNKMLVKGIDLTVSKGKILGIVGESGSGKSISMKSIMNILPDKVEAAWDRFLFDNKDVNKKDILPISIIFQDPMTALNPLRTIEYHMVEVIQRFLKVSKKDAVDIAVKELEKVGINDPYKRLKQYPHELSGGMRQRVMIAMALVIRPKLLIADEPTTALDVTIQAQILYTIKKLAKDDDLTVILVTHDFGVVAGMSDEIIVMFDGKIVEKGTSEDIFYNPQHPYTKQLLNAAKLDDKNDEIFINDYSFGDSNIKCVDISETHKVWLEVSNG